MKLNSLSWKPLAGAVAILVAGLVATGIAVVGANHQVWMKAETRFSLLTERLVGEAARRMNQPRYGMAGAKGVYAASKSVERAEFAAYVASRDLPKEFPGATGFGFIERVMRTDLEAFVAAQRADEAPDFAVWSLAAVGSPLEHALDLYVIKHCFPKERNGRFWGLDIGSTVDRRATAERAATTGSPALSGKLTLWQDNKTQSGFLYMMPVYKNGLNPNTPKERLEALAGLVYTPIILDEALAGVGATTEGELDFEIFDGETTTKEQQLYDYDDHLALVTGTIDASHFAGRMLQRATAVTVGGRTWTLTTSTTPKFAAAVDRTMPLMLGMGGTALSLLAAGFAFSMLSGRARAMALARAMTADLRTANLAAERLAEIARRTTNAVIITDRQGHIEWVNEGFTRIAGYCLEEAKGKKPGQLLQGKGSDPAMVDRMRQAIAAGTAVRAEIINYSKQGREYLLAIEISPLHDAAGVLTGFMAIESDITEERRALSALEESEAKVRAIIDASPVPMAINEADRITFLSPAFRKTFGYDLKDIPTLADWWPKAYPDEAYREWVSRSWQANLEKANRTGSAFEPLELKIVSKSGAEVVVLASAQPITAASPDTVLVVLYDITDRKENEARLQRISERFELAVEAGGVGTWDWDVAADELTWDDRMYALYGVTAEQFGGAYRAWTAGIHPEDRARGDEEIQRALRGEKQFSGDFRVVWPDGTVRVLRASGVVQRDDAGKPVRMVGTNWDVTAEVETAKNLRRAQLAAESASRTKSAFLANMSHEIRTPLTAILGFADILSEDGEGGVTPEQRDATIDTIKNAGTHLLTVINDILDLSKIEADKMTVERIDTPLVTVLREVESLMRPRAAGKGVKLEAVLTTPVPERIVSDPTRLRQILMNLLGNAVKFTEAGSVTMGAGVAELDGRYRLMIDVTDTGSGMTAEQAGNLFRAFGQADDTVTRKHGGTGLGLTICRRLAALMGGDVKLLRTEPGGGSCFRLVLPLEAAAGAAMVDRLDAVGQEATPAVSAVSMKLEGRVLLAEDGVDNQRLIGLHLRKAGATVSIADNGLIALAMIEAAASESAPFDLLLTDMQMPEMDGYTLARTLRRSGSTLAIVALTAHAMAEDREKCVEAGCDDYASKPIEKAKLIATCAAWMGKVGGEAQIKERR